MLTAALPIIVPNAGRQVHRMVYSHSYRGHAKLVCYLQPCRRTSHTTRCLGSWASAYLVPRPGSTVPWKNPISHSGGESHKAHIQSLAVRYSYSALPQMQAETALWFFSLCAIGKMANK